MSDRRTFLRGLASLPLAGGTIAILGQPAAGAPACPPFDAEAFVDDLLAAACRVSLHEGVGSDAGQARWVVYPKADGTQTDGEREVRARWAVELTEHPDADQAILAACRRRARRGLHEVRS